MGRKARNNSHRSARRSGQPHTLPSHGAGLFGAREESGPSWARAEVFLVRQVPPAQAKKVYRCPGCNQTVEPGVGHIVAWPKDYGHREEDRRHWHRGCWQRR